MSPTVLDFAGGAVVAFDLADAAIDTIRERCWYALASPTGRTPTVRYSRDASSAEVVRQDPLRDPSRTVIDGGLDGVVDDLHLTIAAHATDSVFIHAGVVAHAGVAILLPGRSHVGKSTLVEALVRAGAVYMSDEYARVDATGAILPYPRPIHLRGPSGRRLVDPYAIGCVADGSLQPGLVMLTYYRDGAVFAPQPVTPAQAALELFDNAVVARVAPVAAMATVAAIARSAPALRSPRPDATEVAAALLAEVERSITAGIGAGTAGSR